MMKYQAFFFFLYISTFLQAQQVPYFSSFRGMEFVRNPAMTALEDYIELVGSFRKPLSGFQYSPQTAIIGLQFPISNFSMGLGGAFYHDETGPIVKDAFQLLYNYKLSFGANGKRLLSIGFSTSLQHTGIQLDRLVAKKNNDPILNTIMDAYWQGDVQFGLFFHSDQQDRNRIDFFSGLSAIQFPIDPITNPLDKIKRSVHVDLLMGLRIDQSESFIEPSITMEWTRPSIVYFQGNLHIELYQTFWARISLSSAERASVQVGTFINDKIIDNGSLKIGLQGSIGVGKFASYQGLGFEFFIGHQFWNY